MTPWLVFAGSLLTSWLMGVDPIPPLAMCMMFAGGWYMGRWDYRRSKEVV